MIYATNMVYTLPNGGIFSARLTRKEERKELVTRRDYEFGGQPVYWYATAYDLLNRPTNATDSAALDREWLYNRRYELSAASIDTNHYGYAYDTLGNRLWASANADTNAYTANCLNQYASILRTSVSPREPSYDLDGNLTGDGVFTYAYDAENRLLSVTSAEETNGAIRVLNAYDHRHRRIRKVVQRLSLSLSPPPAPPIETREWQTIATHSFVYDGNLPILETVQRSNGSTVERSYFWGMDKSGKEQGAGGVGGLLAVSVNGAFFIPCYDHNGNIVRYISEDGSAAAQYTYDPYGNTVDATDPLADQFPFGFSTKYHDRETGLVSYLMRFYNPPDGRWLNRDPIEEKGGKNLYAFCMNNGVGNVDPLGNSSEALGFGMGIGFRIGCDSTGHPMYAAMLMASARQALCDRLSVKADIGIRFFRGGAIGTPRNSSEVLRDLLFYIRDNWRRQKRANAILHKRPSVGFASWRHTTVVVFGRSNLLLQFRPS